MQRRTGLVLGGAAVCLGALAAVAGSIDSPVVTGGASYDTAVPWQSMFQQGETSLGVVASSGGESEWFGEPAGRPPIGQLVVFSAWLVVAFRKMDALAGVFTTLTGLLALAIAVVLTMGGTAAGTPILREVPVEARFWVLVVGIVAITTAIALSLPDRFTRRDDEESTLPGIDRLRRGGDTGGDETSTHEPSPSNDVEQAWWDVARRVEGDRESWVTSTPREIEREAAAADLSTEVVRDLRRLFEEVRYGDAPVTDDRRERARTLSDGIPEGRPDSGSRTDAGEPSDGTTGDPVDPGPDETADGPVDSDDREGVQ